MEDNECMLSPRAYGRCIATVTDTGTTLDARFPCPFLDEQGAPPEAKEPLEPYLRAPDSRRRVHQETSFVAIDLTSPPEDTRDAYLRLHLLSRRYVQPNTMNLEGIFSILPTVVWTTEGPCAVETFDAIRAPSPYREPLTVLSVDKFPRMLDYVVPSGVRVGDADRVRLGAHLAEGTTVMHEGFVNFNAGTLGPSMVEGRISAGVVVGAGSDIGGGASIMGTLSGGGSERVVIGERVLLGANAGVGISLGDDCVVEAGLYVTAGTRVRLYADARATGPGSVVKATELSGTPGLLFRRHSLTGEVEALPRTGTGIALNPDLHTT